MGFLYDRREVGRVHFLKLFVEKLENSWMHTWRQWTAKICKVRYAWKVFVKIKDMVRLIVENLFRQKIGSSEADFPGCF